MDKTVRMVGHDKKGRFAKGNCANPKGNNQFTSLAPLLEALKKHGKKQNQDFWDMVAERVWLNETVLIAVLKKILPDQVKGEGFGGNQHILIVRDAPKCGTDRIQVPAASEPAKD